MLIKTIDVAGARDLYDRHGGSATWRLLNRALRDRPTRVALDELERAGGRLTTREGSATLWVGLDDKAESRIHGSRVVLRQTGESLPETVMAALPGRRLGDLVAHPVIDDGMRIATVTVVDDVLWLKIEGAQHRLGDVMDALSRDERP